MAKKLSKAEAFEAFLAGVLEKVPAEKRADIEETLRNEAVSSYVAPQVMAQSDYSRAQDELAEKSDALSKKEKEWLGWYETSAKQVATTAAEAQELKDKLNRFEAVYGPLSGEERRAAETMDPAKVEAALLAKVQAEVASHDMASFKVLDILSDLKYDHRDSFKERLDTDALIKFATEKGLPLETAYKEWVAPRVAERESESRKQDIKDAEERGAREALSKHRLPTAPISSGPSIFSIPKDTPVVSNEFERQVAFRDNFVAGINGSH